MHRPSNAAGVSPRAAGPWLLIVPLAAGAQTTEVLPGTQPLPPGRRPLRANGRGHRQVSDARESSVRGERQKFWKRDFSSREAYEKSVAAESANGSRKSSARWIRGCPVKALEYVSSTAGPAAGGGDRPVSAFTPCAGRCSRRVRRRAVARTQGRTCAARVVAIARRGPDAGDARGLAPGVPPESQFARRLARERLPGARAGADRPPGHLVRQREAQTLHQPAAPRMDLPPGLTRWAGTSSATKCRRCWRRWMVRAKQPERKAQRPDRRGGLWRRRPDRASTRPRSTRASTPRWSAAISTARTRLGGADLSQRLRPAARVRRRGDRQPDRAAQL